VDIVTYIQSFNLFDLLVILLFAVAFIIGFIQGTIRRLLGIASVLFSFLLAANLRDPLGAFFAGHWHQFPTGYSYMIAFGLVFVVSTLVFSLLLQGLYHHQPIFPKYPVIDELLGGVLGVIQAMLILGFVIIILDSYFNQPGSGDSGGEVVFLRQLWNAIDTSGIVHLYRETLIPGFFAVFGALVPAAVRNTV
jgi:membrane protein required for colicin V production